MHEPPEVVAARAGKAARCRRSAEAGAIGSPGNLLDASTAATSARLLDAIDGTPAGPAHQSSIPSTEIDHGGSAQTGPIAAGLGYPMPIGSNCGQADSGSLLDLVTSQSRRMPNCRVTLGSAYERACRQTDMIAGEVECDRVSRR